MSLALIGFPLQVGPDDEGRGDVPLDSSLNSEQREALEAAESPGLVYIHGPPGTGKTKTLAATIHSAVARGRRVMAVAPSNAAVDVLADGVCRALQGNVRFRKGLVVRCGETRAPAVRDRWAQAIDLSRLVETRLGRRKGLSRDAVVAESRRVLAEAGVVLTTAARTHLNELPREWEVVVIDEAGMIPVPLAYHVASMLTSTGTLILSGDHRQLPPVIRSTHPLVRRIYQSCLGTVSGKVPSTTQGGVRRVSLTRQHRMAPQLCAWVSRTFYDGQLVTDESVSRRLSSCRSALAVVDSSPLRNATLHPPPGRVHVNPLHVRLISRLLIQMRQQAGRMEDSVVVLTRYRAQAAALKRVLGQDSMVSVATVHGFQGHEADLVVLDVSDSAGAVFGDYLVHLPPEEVGARLLNVAVSRGRRAVIVADLSCLERRNLIPTGSAFRSVVTYARIHGSIRRPDDPGLPMDL